MTAIVSRSAELLGVSLDQATAGAIASRARRTPRIANRLLRRVRDFADVRAAGRLDPETVDAALAALEIDIRGLDETDRRSLAAIIEKFNGGPVGLSTLAAATSEEIATVEDVIEPFLLREGFITRTPRGRMATKMAYEHLGYPVPEQLSQNTLFGQDVSE